MKRTPNDDDTPLAAADATTAEIAAELRRLRLAAGSPTLTYLQHETGLSRTVISEALRGKSLPSERTIDALTRALGADPEPLLSRRSESVRAQAVDQSGTKPNLSSMSRLERPVTRRGVILVSAGTFVAGAVTALAVAALVMQLTARPPGAANITVESGEDPANTACVDDAAIISADTRADNSLVELLWSNECKAGWGRVTRYDAKALGNTISVSTFPQTAPDGPLRQEETFHDVQSVYTDLIVRPSPDTLLCVEGSFTVDGKRIDLGDPICG